MVITLGNLTGLVISSQNGDTAGISDFQRDKKCYRLNTIVTTIDVVTHEEVVCVWGSAANSNRTLFPLVIEQSTEIVPSNHGIGREHRRKLWLGSVLLGHYSHGLEFLLLFHTVLKRSYFWQKKGKITFDLCLTELLALIQLLDEPVEVTQCGRHCTRLIHNLKQSLGYFSLSQKNRQKVAVIFDWVRWLIQGWGNSQYSSDFFRVGQKGNSESKVTKFCQTKPFIDESYHRFWPRYELILFKQSIIRHCIF